MSNQKNLLDFVNDPKNLDKAIEGSMEKRQAIIDQANTLTIEQRLDKALNNLRSRVDESQIEMDDDGDASYVYCTNVAFDKQKQAILQLINEAQQATITELEDLTGLNLRKVFPQPKEQSK